MNTQLRFLYLLGLASFLLVVGCKTTYYDVSIVPEGDTMKRTLVVEDDEEWRPQLEAIYGHEPELIFDESGDEPKLSHYRFSAEFQSLTPDDLGGSGVLLQRGCAMGFSSFYSEQIRGKDDLKANLDREELALDRMIDIALLWFESEFAEAGDYADLRRVIDQDIRHDLQNLRLYLTTFASVGVAANPDGKEIGDRVLEEALVRQLHYLVARDYFEYAELAEFWSALEEVFDDDVGPFVEFVTRLIATKMGVSDEMPLPTSLREFIDNWAKYEESIALFLMSSDALRELLADWNGEPDATVVYNMENHEFIEQLAGEVFTSQFNLTGISPNILRVDLHLSFEPFLTNGVWNDKSSVLQWHENLSSNNPDKFTLPNSLYAAWAEPNVELQEDHFGRILIDNEDLDSYCEWYGELSKKRAREWDKFISTLEPATATKETFLSFKFSDESDMTKDGKYVYSSSAARVVTAAIERALKSAVDKESAFKPPH